MYTVARKGLLPLNNDQPLLPYCANVYNNITFRYQMRTSSSDRFTRFKQNKQKPRVFIGVISAPHHFDKRKTIRETWVQSLDSAIDDVTFEYGFFIGSSNDSLIEIQVIEESSNYEDIIRLLDLSESYRNLTFKTVALLDWTKKNYEDKIDFILKVDDDVYVNVYNLAQVVDSTSNKDKAIYGFGWETEQDAIRVPGNRKVMHDLLYSFITQLAF